MIILLQQKGEAFCAATTKQLCNIGLNEQL